MGIDQQAYYHRVTQTSSSPKSFIQRFGFLPYPSFYGCIWYSHSFMRNLTTKVKTFKKSLNIYSNSSSMLLFVHLTKPNTVSPSIHEKHFGKY